MKTEPEEAILHTAVDVPVNVTGGLVTTLTTELPTFSAALRELIKNAYDASAENVYIDLNTKLRTISICDDGEGMDERGMKNLFNIGRSGKQYGEKFKSKYSEEIRYYQGSKGVGFLSALHFGEKARWISTTDEGITWELECNKSQLEKLESLQDANLLMHSVKRRKRGTRIEVELDNYNLLKTAEIFENPGQISKICNAFRQSDINIVMRKDGQKASCESVKKLRKNYRENNIFYICISSDKRARVYDSKGIIDSFLLDYDKNEFQIEGELVILYLKGSGVDKVTHLFRNDRDTLNPLIYINDNLFEDYSLFNPEITRRLQNTQSLPQMVGYIDVACKNEELKFTSDRSRMVDNTLSDKIRTQLKLINTESQRICSSYKMSHGVEKGFNIDALEAKQAFIDVSSREVVAVGSGPIDLTKFIRSAKDYQGNDVDISLISIYVNNVLCKAKMLESLDKPGKVRIRYEYISPEGKSISALTRVEYKRASKKKEKIPELDIMPYAIVKPVNSYMKVCARLVHAINYLSKLKEKTCRETIACSLRSVFELACFSMRGNANAPCKLRKPMSVENAISAFFDYLSDHSNITAIIQKGVAIDFDTIKNMQSGEYTSRYRKSHRGAHKSSALLSPKDIEDIALSASMLSHMISVLISNEK